MKHYIIENALEYRQIKKERERSINNKRTRGRRRERKINERNRKSRKQWRER